MVLEVVEDSVVILVARVALVTGSTGNNGTSLVPRRSEGRGERMPGTHCLRMRLISEISWK